MLILGIDPGTAILGYGLIKTEASGKLKFISCGCITTQKGTRPELRLRIIFEKLNGLLKKHQPEAMAMENLFFQNNQKTAIRVGQAQGVVLLAAAIKNLPVLEFTPLQVKQAVTGYGRAEKKQVQKMVQAILKLEEIPKPDDAADALAIAICAGHCQRKISAR